MISLNGPAVPLGTGDRGFSLLKEAGPGRNILKIMCAYNVVYTYLKQIFILRLKRDNGGFRREFPPILRKNSVSARKGDKTNHTMNEEKVLAALVESGVPMKSAEVAEATGLPKAEVDKAIKNLVKEGKAESPKRCFYAAK